MSDWDENRVINNWSELCEAFDTSDPEDVIASLTSNSDYYDLSEDADPDSDYVDVLGFERSFPVTLGQLQLFAEWADWNHMVDYALYRAVEDIEQVEGLTVTMSSDPARRVSPDEFSFDVPPLYSWYERAPGKWTVAKFRKKRLADYAEWEVAVLRPDGRPAAETTLLKKLR